LTGDELGRRVAYVIGFSAPPVLQLNECIALLRERDWDCYAILSLRYSW
jgi:hypothetical protein